MNRPMLTGRLPRLCLLLVLASGIAACSLGRKLEERTQIDYKSAGEQRTAALDVPPDLASPRGSDRYRIPDLPSQPTYSGYERDRRQARASEGQAVAARAAETEAGAMRIERSGQQRWLSTSMTPEQLWPLVRDFWQESGFIIDSENPETGIMETDWAENRAKLPQDFIRRAVGSLLDSLYSTGERDKFRTRLERVPGGTEIYVTHRGMVEVYQDKVEKDATIWQPRPSDPELEVEFPVDGPLQFGFGVYAQKPGDMVYAGFKNVQVLRIETESGVPLILRQPASLSAMEGGSALFSVSAEDAESYQWYRDEEPIEGALEPELRLSGLSAEDAGSYWVTVSNEFG